MSPHERVRVRHMVDAVEAAARFAHGRSRADLDRDEMLRFALVRAVEVVGEAAGRVSPEAQAALPEVPWREIVAMRNRLVHAYLDINLDILWTTVTQALPPLLGQLSPIAEQEQARDGDHQP
jgi:uncharacterized protein with HEPN domain